MGPTWASWRPRRAGSGHGIFTCPKPIRRWRTVPTCHPTGNGCWWSRWTRTTTGCLAAWFPWTATPWPICRPARGRAHSRRVVPRWQMDVFHRRSWRGSPHLAAAFSRWPAGTGHFGAHRGGRHCHGARRPLLRYRGGAQNKSLWVHDEKGERQISLEGNGNNPKFTPDGKKLCYLTVNKAPNQFVWYRNPGGLRIADLESGRSEPLVSGLPVLDYDISADGQLVVLSTTDAGGKPRLWVTRFDRSSPPMQIPNVEGGSPGFGAGGDIFFRHLEGTSMFVYRVHPDGTGFQKALAVPVLNPSSVSPDGRWFVGWAPLGGNGPPFNQAFPLGRRTSNPNRPLSLPWLVSGRPLYVDCRAHRSLSHSTGSWPRVPTNSPLEDFIPRRK